MCQIWPGRKYRFARGISFLLEAAFLGLKMAMKPPKLAKWMYFFFRMILIARSDPDCLVSSRLG
jgi:hypothetical protein